MGSDAKPLPFATPVKSPLMMRIATIATIPFFLFTPLAMSAEPAPRYADRWFYASYNLLVDKNTDDLIALIGRAGKAGYNGMVLADFKFNLLDRMPDRYFANVKRVQKAAGDAGIEIIPAIFPIGYSNGLLLNDPNLAEGLPVKEFALHRQRPGGDSHPAAGGQFSEWRLRGSQR